ncbi:hypothetical protein TWF970_006589 [Orbilia oligospora]|uniref:Elongator complex protein 2 n=1 Tax=Orbilia oligospora TaxID=2813651 RepID=A0A7C8VBL5_ORBOL|nr:hypothetical protein TWF970_006589 [Orbilia oligospora]
MTDTRGRIHPRFVSIGANRIPAASDWDINSGFIAYGAGNVIALWRIDETEKSSSGVFATLKGHTDKVSAVRFLDGTPDSSSILLSGGVDKVLRVWKLVKPFTASDIPRYELLVQSPPHDGSIVDIAVERVGSKHSNGSSEDTEKKENGTIIASASADGSIKIWRLDASKEEEKVLTHLQTLTTKPKYFPLSIALAKLSSANKKDGVEAGERTEADVWVLAISGSSNSIQIFVGSTFEDKSDFALSATLTGHENWIRSLSFVREASTDDLLLATGSQDRYIRLWRVHRGTALPAQSAGSKMMIMGQALSNKAHRFSAGSGKQDYSITFEALLVGHEDWVYSASFRKDTTDGKIKLLTASADNSLSIWEADETSGIWVCTARMGEASGMKGSSTATGSTGGFWTGLWSPYGNNVVSFGKNGGWRRWNTSGEGEWVQKGAVAGHIRDVMGVSWEKEGKYLLSTSLDQSTRLYARWKSSKHRSFYEFSRPQIHGYDINSIVSISPTRFVSGADEKLMRVFGEPRGIAKMLEDLCGIQQADIDSLPDVASQPVLGLSNKAVNTAPEENGEGEENDQDAEGHAYPPFEDSLSRHTLWPEEEKLYGHGYEISTIGCSNAGDVIATACKASSISHAVIRMFETKTWRQLKPALEAHSLTVNRIAFSRDDTYMLSVGRDRQWTVFERVTEGLEEFGAPYKPMQVMAKAQTRVIFDGKWVPLEAGRAFVTAARDKTVKVWELQGKDWGCTETVKFEEPITAIDILDRVIDLDEGQFVVLAVGLESGAWSVYKAKVKEGGGIEGWGQWVEVDGYIAPAKAITQIAWKPSGEDKTFEVAISSEDSSVRIYEIQT